jgi:hypothetical protein
MKDLFKILIASLAVLALIYGCNGGGGKREPKGTAGSEGGSDSISIPASVTVNVYIENSGSMDGYVRGVTEFEQSIYRYLSDIKISKIADTLNLFYINSAIIPQGSDIENFIRSLEPSVFKARGGNRGTSDIADVIRTVLSRTHNDCISILVTDGIFSPGRGINAGEYLKHQQIAIRNSMAEYIDRNSGTAVVIYQLSSQFDGTYYNKTDVPTQISGQRPFYIWITGSMEHVQKLYDKAPVDRSTGSGVQNIFSITAGNRPVNYAVKHGSGNFRPDRTDPHKTIVNLGRNSKGRNDGRVTFSVNANLSGLLLNDTYLKDVYNYELNDRDYTLSVTDAVTDRYTHSLNLSSQILKRNSSVSVKLLTKVPQWIEEVNDDDGSAPAEGKTYGIKYQIQGVYEAFTIQNNWYTEIKINIK